MLNGSSEGATEKSGGDVTSLSLSFLVLLQSKEVKQG